MPGNAAFINCEDNGWEVLRFNYLFSVTIYLNAAIDLSAFYSGRVLYTSGLGSLIRFINMLHTFLKNYISVFLYF